MRYKLEKVTFTGTAQGGFQGNNGWIATTDINLVHNHSYTDNQGQQKTTTKNFKVTADKSIINQVMQIPVNSVVSLSGEVKPSRNGACFCGPAKRIDVIEQPNYGQPNQPYQQHNAPNQQQGNNQGGYQQQPQNMGGQQTYQNNAPPQNYSNQGQQYNNPQQTHNPNNPNQPDNTGQATEFPEDEIPF